MKNPSETDAEKNTLKMPSWKRFWPPKTLPKPSQNHSKIEEKSLKKGMLKEHEQIDEKNATRAEKAPNMSL